MRVLRLRAATGAQTRAGVSLGCAAFARRNRCAWWLLRRRHQSINACGETGRIPLSEIRPHDGAFAATLRAAMSLSRSGRATTRLAGLLALLGVIAAVVIFAGSRLLPDLNPFGTETRDRPQPALLQSLQRLDEYHAARVNLQQLVDIERDTKHLPSFVKGERVVMVASGEVDAMVDFRRLGPGSVRADWARREVVITLPAARLGRARLDLGRSRVVEHDRGVLDRAGDVLSDNGDNDHRELLLVAQRKLDAAARADRDLLPTAEKNTAQMLRRLALGLGYRHVTVRFSKPQL